MKECFKCHRVLPVDAFYRHPQMGDGRLGKCRECTRRDVSLNRQKNVERVRAYDRERCTPERRAARGPYDSAKKHANGIVSRAIKLGKISRPEKCSKCGVSCKPHGHHDDHSRPLDVIWLCPVCHAARHREIGKLRTMASLYGEDIPEGY